MTHSVEQHLGMQATEYDRVIRTFIPNYDKMFQEIMYWLKAIVPENGKVVDLGGGTGSLADAIARKCPGLSIEIWDTDPKMLQVAGARLERYGNRIVLVEKSFDQPLPECSAVVTTLALHHVKDLEKKTEIYTNVFKALRSPGIFLNGDCTMSSEKHIQEAESQLWTKFMKSQGMTHDEVQKRLAEWAEEDRYFSIFEEISALQEAGFSQPECFWKHGPMAVYGGVKK